MTDHRNPPRPESAVWTIHGTRSIYSSWWCEFEMVDVETPSGRRFEHEAVRFPAEALFSWHPSSGSSDQRFHLHRSTTASHLGEPSELDETVEVAWVPLADLADMVAKGEIADGLTVVAVWRILSDG